jgi:acetoin utilization deacetylase AcuC-like enzyme
MQQKEIQVENPERAEIVVNSPKGLIYRHSLRNVKLNKNITPAKLGDIVRVHDSNYIGEIKKFCEIIDDGEL